MRGMPLVSKFTHERYEKRCEIYLCFLKTQRLHCPNHQSRVNRSDPVIRHNAPATGKRFGLACRKWFPNIKDAKKYKAQNPTFPVQYGEWEKIYQHLPGCFINDHELWVFLARVLRGPTCNVNAEQRDEDHNRVIDVGGFQPGGPEVDVSTSGDTKELPGGPVWGPNGSEGPWPARRWRPRNRGLLWSPRSRPR